MRVKNTGVFSGPYVSICRLNTAKYEPEKTSRQSNMKFAQNPEDKQNRQKNERMRVIY